MELIWTIDSIKDNVINWRLIGTDTVSLTNDEMPIIIKASVYGQIVNATDTSIEYIKSVLNSEIGIIPLQGNKVDRLEANIIDNLTQQRQQLINTL